MNPHPPIMFCRDCGHDLRDLTTQRCPRCSLRFNPTDPETFDSDAGPVVSIARTDDSAHAYVLKSALAAIGIPANVTGDLIDPGIAFFTSPGAVELWVGKRHETAARAHLASLKNHDQLAETSSPIDASEVGESLCPNCTEPVPDNFAVCWNCGTEFSE